MAANVVTMSSCSEAAPQNSTSRLSAKCRKKVRSVSPARAAISATVVCSNPRSLYSSMAACSSRPRPFGSQRPIRPWYLMSAPDIGVVQ